MRAFIGWFPVVGFIAEAWVSPHFTKSPDSFQYYVSAMWHGVWIVAAVFGLLWSIM